MASAAVIDQRDLRRLKGEEITRYIMEFNKKNSSYLSNLSNEYWLVALGKPL